MTWVADHIGDIFWYAGQHTLLAGIPLIIGLIIALPLGWVARRYSKLYGFLIAGSGLLYTIPSLALFILMPLILGTRILDTLNVYVAMTLYTLALLVRTVADGLGAVPDSTRQAAVAMGFTGMRRLLQGRPAAGRPRHRRGPARRRGQQRQHRQRRVAGRVPAARLLPHRRLPAELPHRDHRRHRRLRAAGADLRHA